MLNVKDDRPLSSLSHKEWLDMTRKWGRRKSTKLNWRKKGPHKRFAEYGDLWLEWNGSHTVNVWKASELVDAFEFGYDEKANSADSRDRLPELDLAACRYLAHNGYPEMDQEELS